LPRRVSIKASEYEELISSLTLENKISFYEKLAHNLTICNREFWSDNESSDSHKITQMKWLNEILHRIISKCRVERIQKHTCSEASVIEMMNHYVKEEPSIGGSVAWAIQSAYKSVAK